MLSLISTSVLFMMFAACSSNADDEPKRISVIRGKDANLPCGGLSVVKVGDVVTWYKNDLVVTSYRNNNGHRREAKLHIIGVTSRDTGTYRCRVNGEEGPAKDYIVDVDVIDIHGHPIITFERNHTAVVESNIGPIREGSELRLKCEVEDSDPSTRVTWFRNGVPFLRAHQSASTVCCSHLAINNMTRSDHGTRYDCISQSRNVSKSAGFVVQMILPPLNVSIRTDNNDDFEAGSPRVLACIVYGCVPSPNVTWFIGDTMLRPNVYKEVNRGNFTVSSLTFVPSLTDNGKELVCKVSNDYLTESFEDRVTVRVGHRPMCVNSELKTIGAVEGDSETLVCIVESNPEPEQFIWTFADGRTIYTSSKQKVIGHDGRYSSALVWVPRNDDFGALYCRASNRFGEQKQPCTFSVINGGPPTTPDCDTFWDQDTLKIICDKSWDGGRPQTIHIEVKGPHGTRKVSRKGQELEINSLHLGENVSAELYASNSRGRSSSVQLILPSGPHPNVRESHSSTKGAWTDTVGYFMYALLAGLLLSCVIACIYIACRKRKRRYEDPGDRDGTFTRGEELSELTRTNTMLNKYVNHVPRLYQANSSEYIASQPDCSDCVLESPSRVTFPLECSISKRDKITTKSGLEMEYYCV